MDFSEAGQLLLTEIQAALDAGNMVEYERLRRILSATCVHVEIVDGKVTTGMPHIPKGAQICPDFSRMDAYRQEKEGQV